MAIGFPVAFIFIQRSHFHKKLLVLYVLKTYRDEFIYS